MPMKFPTTSLQKKALAVLIDRSVEREGHISLTTYIKFAVLSFRICGNYTESPERIYQSHLTFVVYFQVLLPKHSEFVSFDAGERSAKVTAIARQIGRAHV